MIKKIYTIVIIITMFSLMVCISRSEEGLVGYWGFDEGKGSDVKDLSGSGNDGIIKGKADWVQGKVGGGLAFNKAGQGYVAIQDNKALDISEQITMAAWIKPSEIYVGEAWQERNCIIAKLRAYYMDISDTGNLASYLYNVQPQQWLIGTIDLTKFLNTWVHVAVVYDGKEQRLYVNGKLDIAEKKSGTITMNDDPLSIGWVDNNRYFDGVIDEVKLYSRGLTEDELTGLKAVSPNSKLAICWGLLK